MTSTRENMRRELRELSKLADEMRKTRSPDVRSSGEWSALGAALAAEGEAGAAAGDAAEPAALPPPRPSDVSVPPAVASYAPVFAVSPGSAAVAGDAKARRRAMILGGGVAAGAVIALVATFSRSHGGASHASSDSTDTTVVAAAAPGPQAPAAPAADPAPAPPAAAPVAQDPAAAAADPSPSNTPATTPAAKRHVRGGAVARPVTKAPAAALSKAPASKKAAAPAAASGGGESLDDLMRKAVNSPSK
jgi:hypothetical protein